MTVESYYQRAAYSSNAAGAEFDLEPPRLAVGFTEEQQRKGGIEYNYRREAAWQLRGSGGLVAEIAATTGTDAATYTRERPGLSAFVLEDGVVYHAYSAYARGLDGLWGMYQWLDRAPKGRNETSVWWRRHDEYGTQDKRASKECCR